MKLFDDFEAVRFPEENLILLLLADIFIIFTILKTSIGKKYRNAGNDHITVNNYEDVSKKFS